jgi:hypothetical protein
MGFFKRLIDFITLGSPRPMRRLVAYYAVLAVVTFLLYNFVPSVDRLLSGEGAAAAHVDSSSRLLQDGLNQAKAQRPAVEPVGQNRIEHAEATVLVFLATLALMLPVSWVYMSARRDRAHNQSVVQTLLVLPMIVAGVILIVRDSLALAFSLAGVVAAVRFRTSLADARDVVFIFLAIAVGFAAGVQVLSVAAMLSLIFNFVLVLIWQYDFGRNMLEPTAASQWAAPLSELTGKDHAGATVPDRDLVLALTPKKVGQLSERFKRVQGLVGRDGKAPRFTAVLSLTTTAVTEAQTHVEAVLESLAKRWKLDEVVTNEGKPSELFYLIRPRKTVSKDQLITEIRGRAGTTIEGIDLEVGDALATEQLESKAERKELERAAKT